MKHLEEKISESKQSYSASLKRLELLNTEMHERRALHSSSHHYLDPRQVSSTGTSPEMMRAHLQMAREEDTDDVISVDSLQLSKTAADFNGSTGSLPSIGVLSNSELSQSSESDIRSFDNPLRNSEFPPSHHGYNQVLHRRSSSQGHNGGPWYQDMRRLPSSEGILSRHDLERGNTTHVVHPSQNEAEHPSNRVQEQHNTVSYHNQDNFPLGSVPTHQSPTSSNHDREDFNSSLPHEVSDPNLGLDTSSHVRRVASDIVVQSLTTALSRLNQETTRDTET